jgi:hypothetical protein
MKLSKQIMTKEDKRGMQRTRVPEHGRRSTLKILDIYYFEYSVFQSRAFRKEKKSTNSNGRF